MVEEETGGEGFDIVGEPPQPNPESLPEAIPVEGPEPDTRAPRTAPAAPGPSARQVPRNEMGRPKMLTPASRPKPMNPAKITKSKGKIKAVLVLSLPILIVALLGIGFLLRDSRGMNTWQRLWESLSGAESKAAQKPDTNWIARLGDVDQAIKSFQRTFRSRSTAPALSDKEKLRNEALELEHDTSSIDAAIENCKKYAVERSGKADPSAVDFDRRVQKLIELKGQFKDLSDQIQGKIAALSKSIQPPAPPAPRQRYAETVVIPSDTKPPEEPKKPEALPESPKSDASKPAGTPATPTPAPAQSGKPGEPKSEAPK